MWCCRLFEAHRGKSTDRSVDNIYDERIVLSSRAKNSISEMTNGSEYVSPVWSLEMIGNREGFGVGGTWLQLMCCAVSRRRVPNFGRRRLGQRSEIQR